MKRNVAIVTASLLCVSLLSGCGTKKDEDVKVTPKIVKAQSVQEQSLVDGLTYIGVVKAKDTKNYSFLMSGKIATINVEKGQKFKKGDVLATMDTKTLQYTADISGNTSETAKATLEKTISTYDTNRLQKQVLKHLILLLQQQSRVLRLVKNLLMQTKLLLMQLKML